jgi:hypothetical protein
MEGTMRLNVRDVESAKKFCGNTAGLRQIWELETVAGCDVGATSIIEQDNDKEERLVGTFLKEVPCHE